MNDGSKGSRLKVAFVCNDLGVGGAARATVRIARSLQARGEDTVRLRMFAANPTNVPGLDVEGLPGGLTRIRRGLSRKKSRVADRLPWSTPNKVMHSRADIRSGMPRALASWAPDIVHLHWLGRSAMSIREVGELPYPIVWTLHDMWVILGAEHVAYDDRYVNGYATTKRPDGERGVDWNRLAWQRKRTHWNRPMHLVTPSAWLTDTAKRSALAEHWTVTTIPNPVDTSFWRPLDRNHARESLGLPQGGRLLLASSPSGMSQVKGADLLRQTLSLLASDTRLQPQAPELILIGSDRSRETGFEGSPIRIHNLGEIQEDLLLRLVYSAADVTLVPSRIESFSQVAAESLACGTPVVAFGVGGLLDVVRDFSTGRLARPEDPKGLASATAEMLLLDAGIRREMGAIGARDIAERFSPDLVAEKYEAVYHQAVARPA